MSHVWWHNCITVGDDTGAAIPLKVREGKRGNLMGLLRIPHGKTDDEAAAIIKQLDSLAIQMVNLVREPQENIVFNPMQGKPTPLP
jgi:hypothetical protein